VEIYEQYASTYSFSILSLSTYHFPKLLLLSSFFQQGKICYQNQKDIDLQILIYSYLPPRLEFNALKSQGFDF
jgi:hypothetical protein